MRPELMRRVQLVMCGGVQQTPFQTGGLPSRNDGCFASQPELVHPPALVSFVFGRITQHAGVLARFLGQRPDDALAGRQDVGLAGKDGILEGCLRVDDSPAAYICRTSDRNSALSRL